MDDRHGKGDNLSRKRVSSLSTAPDTRCGCNPPVEGNKSPEKGQGMPLTMLIKEEMSKKGTRRNSPNVVARLMGLDSLPSPQPMHKQKETTVTQKTALMINKHVSYKDQSFGLNSKEEQEFKDVFEVTETSDKLKNYYIEKGLPKLNRSDKEIDFRGKRFLDANPLSTEQMLPYSEGRADAFDVSNANIDNTLPVFQETNSVSTRLDQDQHSFPFDSQPRHNTILRSRNVQKKKINEILRSKRDDERHIQMLTYVRDCLHETEYDLIGHSVKEHSVSPCRFENSKFESKEELCSVPTRIVVLKPTLEKVRSDKITMSSADSAEKFQPSNRRQKEHLRSRNHKFSEVRDAQLFSDELEVVRPKSNRKKGKTSRERKHNKIQNVTGSFNMLSQGNNDIAPNGRSSSRSENEILMDAEVVRWDSGCSDDRYCYYKPSSFHSAESSVNRDRKHHSKQWRMSQSSKNVGHNGQNLNTLGEMLAFSDRETCEPSFIKEMHHRWDGPSGISSRDGWKDMHSRKLMRSDSLPPSHSVARSSKSSNRTGSLGSEDCFTLKDMLNLTSVRSPERNVFNQKLIPYGPKLQVGSKRYLTSKPGEEENEHPMWAAFVNPSEQKNSSCISKNSPVHCPHSTVRFYDAKALIDDTSVFPSDTELPSKYDEDDLQVTPVTVESSSDGNSITERNDIIFKGLLPDQPQILSSNSHSYAEVVERPITSSNTQCSISDLAPSFAESGFSSVLEPPEEEESNDSCFERVNADLQGLSLQLRLLKQESADVHEEGSDVSSLEDTSRETCQKFRDEGDRDFSYLLDMLTLSGLQDPVLDLNSAMCHLPEPPVGTDIFEKLEKWYGGGPGWPRAERRLLFDITNSILLKLLVPDGVLHPWVKPVRKVRLTQGRKVIVEDVWQLLVERRKDLNDGNTTEEMLVENWLGVIDDVDMMGKEMEMTLMDELLDDFVSDLLF